MAGLGSGPRWGLGRLGLERATLRTSPYGMASGGQEEPFSRLALAVRCDESSLYLQKCSAHSCSNFGGKIQN